MIFHEKYSNINYVDSYPTAYAHTIQLLFINATSISTRSTKFSSTSKSVCTFGYIHVYSSLLGFIVAVLCVAGVHVISSQLRYFPVYCVYHPSVSLCCVVIHKQTCAYCSNLVSRWTAVLVSYVLWELIWLMWLWYVKQRRSRLTIWGPWSVIWPKVRGLLVILNCFTQNENVVMIKLLSPTEFCWCW